MNRRLKGEDKETIEGNYQDTASEHPARTSVALVVVSVGLLLKMR